MTTQLSSKPIIGQRAFIEKDNFIGLVVNFSIEHNWIILEHPTLPRHPHYRYRVDEVQLINPL